MTPRKPSSSASCWSSTNSWGLTQRSTGWWRSVGRRYWVMVSRSHPAAARSAMASETSARVSPMPRIRLDLVIIPFSRPRVITPRERS